MSVSELHATEDLSVERHNGRRRTTQPRGSLALGVSVSNPTPVVSVTLCDANDRAEFDGLSRQKPEMKEDLHHF
jgi:hypothetical protein